uniref:Uncharacterized protein n=1 Tax=Solanum tuberosum TaxID=4113 RepID=M1DQJ2_SOLTU
MAHSSSQFSDTSFGGRGSHRGSSSFQRCGPVPAFMQAAESAQLARGSYGSGRSGHDGPKSDPKMGQWASQSGSPNGSAMRPMYSARNPIPCLCWGTTGTLGGLGTIAQFIWRFANGL